ARRGGANAVAAPRRRPARATLRRGDGERDRQQAAARADAGAKGRIARRGARAARARAVRARGGTRRRSGARGRSGPVSRKSAVKIATRGSKLALWQAEHVRAFLQKIEPGLEVELVIIKTTGDKILDVPLAAIGGKALFVKEIEDALSD